VGLVFRWQMSDKNGQAPHCDPNVLHKPGECEICDKYCPEAQQERIRKNINFTGHDDLGKEPCPAWAARGKNCQSWQGNVPYKTIKCSGCGKDTSNLYDPCLACVLNIDVD